MTTLGSTRYRVGIEIVTYCGRCKLSLGHIITAMNTDSTVAKVQCRTCGGHHKFSANAGTARSGAKKSVGSGAQKKKQIIEDAISIWEKAIANANPVSYSPREVFKKGDVIQHSQFGLGVVEKMVDQNKMDVIFKNFSKMLIHNINK